MTAQRTVRDFLNDLGVFGSPAFNVVAAAILAVAAVALCILVGVQSTAQSAAAARVASAYKAPTLSAAATPKTVAVVGDSISSGWSAGFDTGELDPITWTSHLASAGYVFQGGWAVRTATTTDMATHVRPYNADVLVILAGSNDLFYKVPWSKTQSNLAAIVAGTAEKRVVVVATPPRTDAGPATIAFNGRLKAFAAQQGWTFVDPMGGLVDGSGNWIPKYTIDGIHPTQDASSKMAPRILDGIKSALKGSG